ncbi:hypothetical protein MASR2M117_10270 [Paludibacter sp.]
MKRVLFSIVCLTIILSSCDKQDINNNVSDDLNRNYIEIAANELSLKHDSIVLRLLENNDSRAILKISEVGDNQNFVTGNNLSVNFDMIEKITGVKPEIISNQGFSNYQIQKVAEQEMPVFDFDQQNLNLSDYTDSQNLDLYLKAIDDILQSEEANVDVKIQSINDIQQEAKSNQSLNTDDYMKFINTTEVLKGSLILWSKYASEDCSVKESIKMRAKSPTQWSFAAKLAFVAAADAVGAVAGTYIGGYIIVSGVPIYIPAGPQGTVAGLATLSFLAAKMVGW